MPHMGRPSCLSGILCRLCAQVLWLKVFSGPGARSDSQAITSCAAALQVRCARAKAVPRAARVSGGGVCDLLRHVHVRTSCCRLTSSTGAKRRLWSHEDLGRVRARLKPSRCRDHQTGLFCSCRRRRGQRRGRWLRLTWPRGHVHSTRARGGACFMCREGRGQSWVGGHGSIGWQLAWGMWLAGLTAGRRSAGAPAVAQSLSD